MIRHSGLRANINGLPSARRDCFAVSGCTSHGFVDFEVHTMSFS